MYRNNAKVRKPFKPPVRASKSGGVGVAATSSATSLSGGTSKSSVGADEVSPSSYSDELKHLEANEARLDEEIRVLRDKGHKPEELQEYINLLHEYNEIKDIAQMFLGRLAFYECVTTRVMARRYNAPDSD